MNKYESLLVGLGGGDRLPLCEDDYEDFDQQEEPYTGILSDRATVEECFGELVHYESQGGYGE